MSSDEPISWEDLFACAQSHAVTTEEINDHLKNLRTET